MRVGSFWSSLIYRVEKLNKWKKDYIVRVPEVAGLVGLVCGHIYKEKEKP